MPDSCRGGQPSGGNERQSCQGAALPLDAQGVKDFDTDTVDADPSPDLRIHSVGAVRHGRGAEASTQRARGNLLPRSDALAWAVCSLRDRSHLATLATGGTVARPQHPEIHAEVESRTTHGVRLSCLSWTSPPRRSSSSRSVQRRWDGRSILFPVDALTRSTQAIHRFARSLSPQAPVPPKPETAWQPTRHRAPAHALGDSETRSRARSHVASCGRPGGASRERWRTSRSW